MTDGPQLPSDRVADALRARLQSGEWAPGGRMPAASKLAADYSTSRATVMKALRKLADEHLVTIVPNWGTFRAES